MNMNPIKRKLRFRNLEDLPVRITDSIGSTTSIILHTIFFVGIFVLRFFGVSLGDILLILTTVVSLEAIYLAIFIQMTVNRNTQSLEEVEEDIDVMQKEFVEISEDIEEIQEDDRQDDIEDAKTKILLETIEGRLQRLVQDIETLKQRQK